MSAKHCYADVTLKLAIVCGLCGYSGAVLADDEEQPDMAFLEYLGTWEASDEDWVLFTVDAEEDTESDNEKSDPEPQAEKVAELDDE